MPRLNNLTADVVAAMYGVAWVPFNTYIIPNSEISVNKAKGRIIETGLTLKEAMEFRDTLIIGAPRDGYYVTF